MKLNSIKSMKHGGTERTDKTFLFTVTKCWNVFIFVYLQQSKTDHHSFIPLSLSTV